MTLFLEVGCAITAQIDMKEGLSDVRIAPSNGSLNVSLKTPTLDRFQQGSISESQSFATYSDGKRYGIIANPNDYARNYPEKSYFTSDYIWLKGDHGEKLKWKEGEWNLLLVLQSKERKIKYRAKFGLKAEIVSLIPSNGEF